MKRKIELGTAIFFIFAAVLVTGIITYMYMDHKVEGTREQTAFFDKVTQVYNAVNRYYIGEIDNNAALDSMLNGYVAGVDDYGVYLNKTDYNNHKKDAEGKQSGIGATVKYVATTGYMKITRVNSGSPCDQAGMVAGDVINQINGVDLSTMSYTEAANRLKADIGTEIKIGYLRGEEQLTATVMVQEYRKNTVTSRLMVNKIGYISISEFDDNTAADFKAAVESFKKKGVTNLIFDVRNNTGGSLDAVVDVLDYVLPKGTLCTVEDKMGEKVTYSSDESCLEGKFVVLINGSTYSGGELFAAAIRDYKYGTLIGTTTYGKGMAQEIFPLDNDETALYLSTHVYYPPNGENYEGVGVAPHQEVALTPELENRFYELTYSEDPQLQAAVEAIK